MTLNVLEFVTHKKKNEIIPNICCRSGSFFKKLIQGCLEKYKQLFRDWNLTN